MNTAPKQTRLGRTATRISLIAGLAVTLGACLTNAPEDPTAGLSFRADRFAQMEQLGSYQTCHDEAMMLDAVRRQRPWDRMICLHKGGFLAHRRDP